MWLSVCMESSSDGVTLWSSHIIANALTLINTVLLISSGMVAVAALHASSLRAHILYSSLVVVVVVAATAFLSVQCMEYMHLYWTISTRAWRDLVALYRPSSWG